jgi:hypothetical protein
LGSHEWLMKRATLPWRVEAAAQHSTAQHSTTGQHGVRLH